MRRRAGFTMIEMLAAMLLLGILGAGVVNFYIQLSRESNAAAAAARMSRRGAAVADRIAHELEASILVLRPDGVDPLEHPWIFYAERDRGAEGADRVRFTTRGHTPPLSASHESDVEVVAYALREDPGGGRELVRWSSPHLPEGLDRRVPEREEDGAQVLADGVTRFGLRFLTESGEWKDAWDSSSVVDSNQLPLAVEIQVALADPEAPEDEEAEESPTVVREVVLPLRPLDLQSLLTPADAEGDEDKKDDDEDSGDEAADSERDENRVCVTVSQCLAANPGLDLAPALTALGLPQGVVATVGDQCASDFASYVSLPGNCL